MAFVYALIVLSWADQLLPQLLIVLAKSADPNSLAFYLESSMFVKELSTHVVH